MLKMTHVFVCAYGSTERVHAEVRVARADAFDICSLATVTVMSLLLSRAARPSLLRASTSTSRVSALSIRNYAKKNKNTKDMKDVELPPRGKKNTIQTSSLISHSQQKIQDPTAAAEYDKADEKMTAAVAWFKRETAQGEARAAGRVTPALLDPVRVVVPEMEGYRAKIEEVATVGVRDGSVLVVTVFEPEVSGACVVLRDERMFNGALWAVELETGRRCIIRCAITWCYSTTRR